MQVNGGGWGEGEGNYYLHCLSSIYGAIIVIPLYNYKFILKTAVTDGSLSPKTFISIQKKKQVSVSEKSWYVPLSTDLPGNNKSGQTFTKENCILYLITYPTISP